MKGEKMDNQPLNDIFSPWKTQLYLKNSKESQCVFPFLRYEIALMGKFFLLYFDYSDKKSIVFWDRIA